MSQFKYFNGPREDMSDLLDGVQTCSICNIENGTCFQLDYAITNLFSEEDKEGKIGCVNCLTSGEFEFWHDTEFGMLDEQGLTKVYNHNMNNPPRIQEQVLSEMRRTPQIVTWQQELWLTHCDDFMVYLGTWDPKDFYLNSPNGNGKQLFLEMTDEYQNLWDDSLGDNKQQLQEWYATYYVFKCSHCGKLRGNWDCD